MDVSDKSRKTKNVGRNFQAKWLQRAKVELSPDVESGWVPKEGIEIGIFTKQDREDLEMEVLEELGYI
jgi:hypothetical protein